jgi:hypothetical protein
MGRVLAVTAAGVTMGLLGTQAAAHEIRSDVHELRRDRRERRRDVADRHGR